jgi:hypothetical protein
MKRKKPVKRKKPGSVHKEPASPEKPAYRPTAREQAMLDQHEARTATKSPAPRILLVNPDEGRIIVDHLDEDVACKLLMEALGTTDHDFSSGIIRQLFEAGDKLDEVKFNFLLAVIKDGKPNDQFEAMLFAQMAVLHVSIMKFGRRFDQPEYPTLQDGAAGALAKLMRTFAAQLEAFKRYRGGGEQKITVQHVSVNDGGQAIVGNITHSAPETALAKPVDSTLALTDARQPAMPILSDRKRARVPLRREQKNDRRSSA